jgi:hypothetical protein
LSMSTTGYRTGTSLPSMVATTMVRSAGLHVYIHV